MADDDEDDAEADDGAAADGKDAASVKGCADDADRDTLEADAEADWETS